MLLRVKGGCMLSRAFNQWCQVLSATLARQERENFVLARASRRLLHFFSARVLERWIEYIVERKAFKTQVNQLSMLKILS